MQSFRRPLSLEYELQLAKPQIGGFVVIIISGLDDLWGGWKGWELKNCVLHISTFHVICRWGKRPKAYGW